MAIHAQKSTFRSSAQFPDFLVTGPLTAGQLLCYSEIAKAFVNKDAASIVTGGGGGGGGGGSIDGATNIGTGAQIFESVNGSNKIQLRTLLGGQGISLAQGANEIEITNDIIANAGISVPDSFTVTIDNDNTTTDTARFNLFTNSNPANITVSPVATYNAPALDLSVVLPDSFFTATGDFVAAGFVAGMCLEVTGTTEQDGIWEIDTITNDTIKITIPFPNQTDAGLQPITTLEGMFVDFTATTITMFGRDFAQDGFLVGHTLDIVGSTGNDGTYSIALVVGDSISINETFPAPGCDVGNITLSVPVQDHSTGWWVNELGEMVSNATTINGDLDITNGFDINIDQGTLNLDGVDIIDLINNSAFSVPTDGIIVQTSTGNFTTRSIAVGAGLSVVDSDGIAGDPTISVDAFDITLGGEITGTGTVTDLGDVVITTTLEDNGVVAGIYNKVTVDSTGRVTVGQTETIIGSNGINVANGNGIFGSPDISASDFDITLAGDVIGTAIVNGLTDTTINVTLDAITTPGTYNSVTIDAKGRVVSGALIPGGSFQAADAALDDLSGGLDNPGITVWDGTIYRDRVLTGFVNEIEIANPGGQFANPIIGLADNPVLPGVGAVTIPRGFDGDRPASPTDGMMRYRLDGTEFFEGYVEGQWRPFMMDSVGGFLELSGGVMSGNIDMGGTNITNVDTVDGRDLEADGLVIDSLNNGLGIKVQTGVSTFVNREIEGVAPVVVTNGDGVGGNPTVEWDMLSVPSLELGQVVDEINDEVLIYDDSQAALRRVSPKQLNNRMARRYFMAQF